MSTPAAMALAVRRLCKDWGLGTAILNGAVATSTITTVPVVDYPDTLVEGLYLEMDLELVEVTNVAPSLTVRRAQLGTTGAIHASGVVCIVQPRYTNTSITSALNEALHILSGKWPRDVYLTDTTLATAADTESFTLPAETVGEGEYIEILEVELETATTGLYRPIYTWFQEGRFPPVLRLKGNEGTGRALRLHCTQAYYPMGYNDLARPVGLVDDLEVFLTKYAAGLLLENDELYAANWIKQDVQVSSDMRGRMQVIGRNMQASAEAYLQKIRPSTRNLTLSDSRNYRR